MTDTGSHPTSSEELSAAMQQLLRRAAGNGIDVRGGWECRNGPGHPDWDVLVTEVEKKGDSQ